MTAPILICDPQTGYKAKVTEFGQLVVAPIAYSSPITAEMSLINTPYLLVSPVQDKSIVFTTLILTANRDVGVNDATVSIYTTATAEGILPANPEVALEMIKSSTLPLTGLNLLIPQGRFVFAQTNDNTVFITLGYYRVPT
jgi:hypothetical protein